MSATRADTAEHAGPYQLFMLGLCLYVLGALAAQTFARLSAETLRILDIADLFVSIVFLVDFFQCLVRAPDRRRYLLRWGWLDLLSSLPMLDLFRWGRAARVFRILRVLRGLRAARVLAAFTVERRAASAFWSAALIALLAVIFGSIAILHLERAPDANITQAEEALWWAFVTVTTVGYGDVYPVTSAGRVLAALLMAIGIGLFGTLTACLATAFMAPEEEQQEDELARLRDEVRALRGLLEQRAGGSAPPG